MDAGKLDAELSRADEGPAAAWCWRAGFDNDLISRYPARYRANMLGTILIANSKEKLLFKSNFTH